MSNEEIVVMIQKGRNDLYADLWEQIERLVRWKAKRTISAIVSHGGFDFEDLYQSGYLAMVEAVNTYTPGAGSFVGWFMLHLKKAFAAATGYLTQKQKKDPIHLALSLDSPIADDVDNGLFSEVIPDPAGEIPLRNVEDRVYRQQLRNALDAALGKLPENQQYIIRKKYLEGIPIKQIAIETGKTMQAIWQNERLGLRGLRWPGTAKLLCPFYDFDYYGPAGLGAFKNSGMSIQERYLIGKEQFEQSR